MTDEKVKELIEASKEKANEMENPAAWMATFSANFSLHMLHEYHEWLHQDEYLFLSFHSTPFFFAHNCLLKFSEIMFSNLLYAKLRNIAIPFDKIVY